MGVPRRHLFEVMQPAELAECQHLLGINIAALADLAGVSARAAHNWLSGHNPVPGSLAVLLRLLVGSLDRDTILEAARRRAPNKPKD